MRKIEWSAELWDVVESGCWEWKKPLTEHGYGQFGRKKKAHREAMERHLGRTLEETEHVLHRCDNARCVRPDHLFLGDQQSNMADRDAKRRHRDHDKTHCRNGHEYTPENTYLRPTGRRCRLCTSLAQQRYQQRKKEQ